MKKKENKFGLLKGVLILIAIAIVLSWLIPTGTYTATGLSNYGMVRVGLNDLAWLLFSTLDYFAFDKIMYLVVLGGFYGILIKTNAYNRVVNKLATTFSKNKKLSVVLISVFIGVLTSILTSTYAVLLIIPFLVSILNRMKLDKMTIFATTFGSILVGILGATFGTDGVSYLYQYMVSETEAVHDVIYSTILVRAGILVIGLVLFNFLTLNRMNKIKDSEVEAFPIEEIKTEKKKNVIPIIIFGIIIFALVILGFINWSDNFYIDIFNELHDTILNVKIGSDFYVLKDLFGTETQALGTWKNLFTFTPILFLFTIVLGLCYRMKFTEFIENFINGVKKTIKPCLCIIGAFYLLVVVYNSPYVVTIIDKFLSLTDGFNLATMTLVGFITNIFHADLGFSGYLLSPYFIVEYVDYLKPIFVILQTTFGLLQFFIPTSIMLGIGLTSLDVKYSDWIKHIWKFIVGMFICLLVIFILLTIF